MTAPITVLLIEDNTVDARLVKEKLRSAHSPTMIQLEWVDCLAKGLEYLATGHFEAVLLDLNLPDSAGLDTLQTVLSHAPNVPVVVMTGETDHETSVKAVQAGAQDYLIKGEADGRLLTRVIHYAIQRKQTEMQVADTLEFTRHLLTSSPIGIFTYRLSGECLSANPAAAQMVGATVEQLERQNFRELESWKRSGLFDLAEQAIVSKQLTASDVHVITTFGKEAWYRAQFVTFKSGGEELLLMIFNDITERKYTEAALEASEKRFRAWIENSSDIVTVVDSSGVIQHESSSVQHLLGYAPEELMGKKAFDFVHPEDQDKIINLFLENIQKPDVTAAAEFRFRHRDGSWRFLEGVGRAYVDEHDEVVGLINSRDITDRRQAEAAIAAMQKRFQALIENAPDGIALLGLDGKLRQVTPSIQQILGYTPQEAEEQEPAALTHPDDLPALLSLVDDLVQNPGKVATVQYRFKHKDGSWRWLESTISNLIGEPAVEAIVFNYRDITDRRQAEENLRDSEMRYRTLMERSLEAIYIYEADTKRVVVANPAFLNALGYSADEVGDLTLYDIVAHDKNSIDKYLEQVLTAGGVPMGERRWRRKDGTTCPVEVTANKIQQGGKDLIFVVGRDIAERQQAEQALKEKERLLSEAQRIGHIGSWSYAIRADQMTFSDEMYRLFDILPEEFNHTSKAFLNLIYASDRPLTTRWLEDIKAGVQSRELNCRIFRQNGELRYLQCTGAINFDNNGEPLHFIGTMQDITERRVAEMRIEQQLKRLTALSEIDHAIMSSFDQRYTLDMILSQVISQLQVDATDVLILESDGQMLTHAAGQGFRAKLTEEILSRLGEGHAGRAVKERRMIRIPDLRETTNELLFNTIVSTEGFVSYIGAPLIVKGKVKGVLEVYQRSFLQPYPEWLDFFNALVGQAAIAIENAELFGNLQTSNQELSQAYDATIEGWSRAMDLRDRETEGHTQRVTSLTLELAHAMGMDESRLVHIRRGALLHDIGKLGVPDALLFRPDQLTPAEMEIMQKHPEFAYEMLSPIAYLKPALAIPYCHHEKWDGTGYPLGLKGSQIPLEARIFAVADVWDTLTSDRPYRKAWTEEEALAYIREQSGKHFDPQVVELFFNVIK